MDWVKGGEVEMNMLLMKMALTQLATHMTTEQMIRPRFLKHILIIRYCCGPSFMLLSQAQTS